MPAMTPRNGRRPRRGFIRVLAGIAATAFLLALCWANPPLLRQLDMRIYDHFLAQRADGAPKGVTALVDVDEASLKEQGQWPWPRYRLARLVQILLEAGASVVALDIMLAEDDRTSLASVARDLRREWGATVPTGDVPEVLLDNDALLAETLRGQPVVLGAYLLFSEQDRATAPKGAGSLPKGVGLAAQAASGDGPPPEADILKATGMVAPLPGLSAAAAVGFFNAPLDEDGLVRRLPMLARVGGRTYANLSLRTLMAHLGGKRSLRLIRDAGGQTSLRVGNVAFPVSAQGYMLLPYRGPARTFPYISAGDVLAGRFDPAEVRGRMLFVGSSAAGTMDIRATPLDRHMPGVEAHATVVDAVLSGRCTDEPAWAPALHMGLIALTALICIPLFSLARPLPSLAGGLALAGGAWAASRHLFFHGLWVSPLWAMLGVGLQAAVLTLVRYWLSETDKRRIRGIFSRYVSPEVVSRIVDRGEESLRGEQRELTVMFTDLRGFTSLSEKLTPVQVVSLLNRYFTPMTALVRGSGGTLDKYIGDALMAFWNAPLDVPDHPAKAVRAALAMQRTLAELNAALQKDFGLTLRMGAGINTGPAHVGNMGSDDLTSYTALGDTVNLASRLEGLCSRYGVTIVVSGETASRCGPGLTLRELARLRVKGKSEPVDVFAVLAPDEAAAQADLLDLWQEAVRRYRKAATQRDAALLRAVARDFEALNTRRPAPLHQAYADACADMLARPVDTWTEVWTLKGK